MAEDAGRGGMGKAAVRSTRARIERRSTPRSRRANCRFAGMPAPVRLLVIRDHTERLRGETEGR